MVPGLYKFYFLIEICCQPRKMLIRFLRPIFFFLSSPQHSVFSEIYIFGMSFTINLFCFHRISIMHSHDLWCKISFTLLYYLDWVSLSGWLKFSYFMGYFVLNQSVCSGRSYMCQLMNGVVDLKLVPTSKFEYKAVMLAF